jgi:hypothetical protein
MVLVGGAGVAGKRLLMVALTTCLAQLDDTTCGGTHTDIY